MVGGYRESYSRSSSDTSDFTRDESDQISTAEDGLTSTTYSAGKEYGSTEWTDEKHSLYLKSMEASFVDQLYSSFGFLGSRINNENSDVVTSGRSRGNRKPSEQQVLHTGLWQQKVNAKQPEYCFNRKNETREFLSSPWIKHFRPLSKTQHVVSPRLEGSSKTKCQVVSSSGKKGMVICGSGSTTCRGQIRAGHPLFREHEQINVGEEVSDQNFIDEEAETENASSSSSSKKMKILMNESSSSDQVVPRGKTPAT